jgi:hypothetical protein
MAKVTADRIGVCNGNRGAVSNFALLLFITVVRFFDRVLVTQEHSTQVTFVSMVTEIVSNHGHPKTTRFFTRTMQSLPTCIFTYLPIY